MAIKPKILIIENDEDMLAQYVDVLKRAGFIVKSAIDYTVALVEIKSNKFDAILTEPLGDDLEKLTEFMNHANEARPDESIVYFLAAHLPYCKGIEPFLPGKSNNKNGKIKILTKPLC